MNKLIRRIDNAISNQLLCLEDFIIDRRICRQNLIPYVASIDRDDKNGIGGTGSQSTHYAFLKRIFADVRLTSSDVFMDVGCGKGRVLAFLVKEKCPCPLYGIEHNEAVGRLALNWAKRYEQIHIIIGVVILESLPLVAEGTCYSVEFADFLKKMVGHLPGDGPMRGALLPD